MNLLPSWLRRWWFLALVVFVGGGGWYWYHRSDSSSGVATPSQQTETIKRGDLSIVVSGSGQIHAKAQVNLKPVVAGDAIEVTHVTVKNDQGVKKGQIIAILDNEDAQRNVEKAELDLRRAKIQQKQTKALYPGYSRGDVRQRQLAAATVATNLVALNTAQAKLDNYTIRAPFDGIVTGLSVESGDTISQTAILASVITQDMKAQITLNEVDAAKVAVGNTVTLSLDALPATKITGVLAKLDTIGVTTQNVVTYGAEVALDSQPEALKPGMSVAADIFVQARQGVLLVPNAAITYSDGEAQVLLVTNHPSSALTNPDAAPTNETLTLRQQSIVVGVTDDVHTEVLSGLSEGDRVAVTRSVSTQGGTRSGGNQGGNFFNIFRGTNR